MTSDDTKQQRIAALNDEFRRAVTEGNKCNVPGILVLTRGISALELHQTFNVLAAVREFSAFTPDNDPYREHDFGSFKADGVGNIFFKIDYYADENMEFGADDPSDPAQSFRTLTVMMAHEY